MHLIRGAGQRRRWSFMTFLYLGVRYMGIPFTMYVFGTAKKFKFRVLILINYLAIGSVTMLRMFPDKHWGCFF